MGALARKFSGTRACIIIAGGGTDSKRYAAVVRLG
jgi:hypothetical protein